MLLKQWPTLVVGLLIYLALFGLTLFWQVIPWPLLLVGGGVASAWYASLEHEVIHGHPTRWRWINRLLVLPPILLWLPFEVYARSHRAHHRDAILTDPFDDPESYYLAGQTWDDLQGWQQGMLAFTNTLLGRLTLGLGLTIALFWVKEAQLVRRGQGDRRRIWGIHLLLCTIWLAYVALVSGLPFCIYVLYFVLPGTALTLLRAFLEHQYAPNPKHRTALVEASWFWRLLFLNNCYHLVHHEHPDLPWHELGKQYVRHRNHYRQLSNGYVIPGYSQVIRRYALTAKEPVRHPSHR